MKAIDKAIWYIENHYREPICLDSLADVAGVSRYHLSRIFCYAVGQPISRYIRLRRLSTAAIALAAGETDILDLALSVGYGSHEAFTRAFKEHFSSTPEQIRKQGHVDNLTLTVAVSMEQKKTMSIAKPRIEQLDDLTFVGISRHYPFAKVAEIPDQWQSFTPLIAQVTDNPSPATYGVIYNGGDDSFDYLSCVELPAKEDPPQNMVVLKVPAQTYLVFWHPGHVATLRESCHAIWSDWLPASDKSMVEAPWIERYGQEFDPETGAGGVEIWIPVSG
jgi:AraC family transcriptional regulator